MMQQDWNIGTRATVCDATKRPFQEGEIFHTALHHEGDVFRREDLSEEAWQARTADPSAPVPFSSWKSKFEPPAPPPPEPLPRDDAEGMLRRLLESNDQAYANTRYLLAVMLERKRVLRPRESGEKGILVYEHARTGETFVIADPQLSLADLAAVQEEVSALLAGLTAPPASESNDEPQGESKGEDESEASEMTEA
jgi:hypothetical protein